MEVNKPLEKKIWVSDILMALYDKEKQFMLPLTYPIGFYDENEGVVTKFHTKANDSNTVCLDGIDKFFKDVPSGDMYEVTLSIAF